MVPHAREGREGGRVFLSPFSCAVFRLVQDGADPTHLYWLAGVVLQAGSFLGSVVPRERTEFAQILALSSVGLRDLSEVTATTVGSIAQPLGRGEVL